MDGEVSNNIIAFFEIKDWEKEYLSQKIPNQKILFCPDTLNSNTCSTHKDANIISVFINSKVDKSLIDQFPNLKLIATRSTGFDHIDVKYCKEKAIIVTNVPYYGENTVAEHAMALLLGLTRRLPESVERVKDGKFSPEGLTGVDIKGKTVGVIGTGHIGKKFIRMVKGFEPKIIAFDKFPDEEFAKTEGFEYVNFDFLLTSSDIISLHAPLNDDTKHMINKDNIHSLKEGVIIINTARGGLIETDALFDAIKMGRLGGAGIDTLEEEGFLTEELELLHKDTPHEYDYKTALENHMMAYLPNVIVTPHNAFNSKEALNRILDTTVENIECFVKGECKNEVEVK